MYVSCKGKTMLDINLLHALSSRKRFNSLKDYVPLESFSPDTRSLLSYFGAYFKTYPDHDEVDYDSLDTMVKLKTNASADQMAILNQMIKQLRQPIKEDVVNNTIQQLQQIRFAAKVDALVIAFEDNAEIDIVHEVAALAIETRAQAEALGEAQWANGDIWEYIQAEAEDAGYRLLPLPEAIHKELKGLTPSKNMCIAMPTDKGKTSLLCAIATSFAKQHKAFLENGYETEFRPVLYLVNEGLAEAITPRVYQSVLHMTATELYELGKKEGGTGIRKRYIDILGRIDAIRLVNIHGYTTAQVSQLIERHNPFCVITDMTGRIRCVGAQGANDVQQLETVWDTMRQFAAIYRFIHIGTAQVSAEGFDNLFPPLSALQNSKTGVQTTLDLALFGGARESSDPSLEWLRGFHTPKNKLKRVGGKGNVRAETIFNPDTNYWGGDY